MAVVNGKSTIVAAADAGKPADSRLRGGEFKEDIAKIEVLAADDNLSVYRLFRVHSSDRISKIDLANDAITAGTSYDVGVYETDANGSAVVDADEFASALDLSGAAARRDVSYEAAAVEIDRAEMPLWQRIGLLADPLKEYDIALTANVVGTVDGTIVAWCQRVMGA